MCIRKESICTKNLRKVSIEKKQYYNQHKKSLKLSLIINKPASFILIFFFYPYLFQ